MRSGAAGPELSSASGASIVGLVVDSLYGGPLVGAQISIDGVNSHGITDSTGRFRVDSVPAGRYRIGVFHPLLDSLGVSVASPPLVVESGATLSLVFATPSASTVVRLMCGGAKADTSEGTGPSVVVGQVLDAETDAPIARARVYLSWTEIDASQTLGLYGIQRQRQATTGPSGEFRFCHLPPDVAAVARAVTGKTDSSAVSRPYRTENRVVSMLVLHLPRPDTVAAQGGRGATPGQGGGVLIGRVVRSDSGGPMVGAQVMVSGSRDTAVSGDSGQFTLRGLPTGTHTVRVRALGWEPVSMPIELTQREPRHIIVPLTVNTAVLQTVVVTAALNDGLHRVGFDTRRQMGLGHFLGPDDIAKRSGFEFVDLLAGVPGVMRRPGPAGEDYLAGTRGGGCVSYVIDGSPFFEMTPGDINNLVPADQVGALEVYQSAETPPQYASATTIVSVPGNASLGSTGALFGRRMSAHPAPVVRTGSCVKVVIWTKARLGLRG